MSVNISSSFVDLGTFGEPEEYLHVHEKKNSNDKYLYRNPKSEEKMGRKAWRAHVPVYLKQNGKNDWHISRAGDLIDYVWVDVFINPFRLKPCNRFGSNGRLSWPKNLLHNIIKHASVIENNNHSEIVSLNTFILDTIAHFHTPTSYMEGYNYSIGNRDELVKPQKKFDKTHLTAKLPFFQTLVPICAIPYTDLKIKIINSTWSELLTLTNIKTGQTVIPEPYEITDINFDIKVGINYIVTNGHDRKHMAMPKHDILLNRYVTIPFSSQDIELKHDTDNYVISDKKDNIKKALQPYIYKSLANTIVSMKPYCNKIIKNRVHLVGTSHTECIYYGVLNGPSYYMHQNQDPIKHTTLMFENTTRLCNPGLHTSTLFPANHTNCCKKPNGLHMYPFAEQLDKGHTGGTNFSKMNVFLHVQHNSPGKLIVVLRERVLWRVGDGFIRKVF